MALPRAATGAPHGRHRQSGRGDDPAGRARQAREESRRRRAAGEGRRAAAHRFVQGARLGHGGVDGEGAGHQTHGDAHQRQRGRGACRLCQPRGNQNHRVLPGRHAGGERQRNRAAGRDGLPRQRAHRRLRQDRRGGQGEGRLVRHVDAEGGVPHRGQEDDGAGTGRATRLGRSRRYSLSDRRRHRADRHVEGVRRTGGDRFHREQAPAHGCRAGDGLRPDGARL